MVTIVNFHCLIHAGLEVGHPDLTANYVSAHVHKPKRLLPVT